jgi:hypothetical protein
MLIRVVARAAAVTVAVGLLGASCAGGPDAAAPAPTPPASTSATAAPTDPAPPATPPPTPAPTATATASPTEDAQADLEAAVLEAHAGYLEASIVSGSPPDPDHPLLLRWATGPLLEKAQQRRRQFALEGHHLVGGYDSHPRVIELTEGRAVIEDCLLDTAPWVDASGAVVEPVLDGRRYFQTIVVRAGEQWKVSELLSAGEPCDF